MIVNEKYECQEIIGEGSYSQVNMAVDNTTQEKVALKCFKYQNEESKGIQEEANMLFSLNHKNVIRLIEFEPEANVKNANRVRKISYIATELAEKGCLFEYIKASQGMSEQLA